MLVLFIFLFIMLVQYLAYLSWLKLGEVAVNPFGEDDDDFDIIGLFENHVQVYNILTSSLSDSFQLICL